MLKEKNKINSICHSSFDGESHQIPAFAGMTESGRSMVEMLGVLAVIGVLSVAGIAGYTNAMNKHRANELLNEASKRAVVLAMKIAAGGEVPTDASDGLISEFSNPAGYTFKVLKNPANPQQSKMEIDGVSKEVCEQMKAAMGGPVRGIDCPTGESGTATFIFNNDMSMTPYPSDYKTPDDCKTPFVWCATTEKCQNSEETCAPLSNCPEGSSTTGLGGDTGVKDGEDMCKCNNTDEVYTSSGCEDISSTCPQGTTVNGSYTGTDPLNDGKCICNDYMQNVCGLGYYCQSDGNITKCSGGNGTCHPVSELESDTHNYHVYSRDTTTWWSANSWCIGIGSTGLITTETAQYMKDNLLFPNNFSTVDRIGCLECNNTCPNGLGDPAYTFANGGRGGRGREAYIYDGVMCE